MKQLKLHKKTTRAGFTIIEVSLTMTFIAILLIIIALTVSNIMTVFQKGITIKSVNSVGRNLVSEFTQSINLAPSIDSTSLCQVYANSSTLSRNNCIRQGAYKFIFQNRTGEAMDSGATEDGTVVQYYGLLCTGRYTYAWNTYYGIKAKRTLKIVYKNGETPDNFRLVRFEDTHYRACTQNVSNDYEITNNFSHYDSDTPLEIDMTKTATGVQLQIPAPQDGFLESAESDINLDLYEFVVFPISQDAVTLRAFFSGTFVLATNNGDINIMRTGDYCDPHSYGARDEEDDNMGANSLTNLGSGFNYCGINRFNFAARTAGNSI